MKLGFLGAGKMAEAVMAGVLRCGVTTPDKVVACDKIPARLDEVRKAYGVGVAENPAEVLRRCDVVVLAVKPQDLDALLRQIGPLARRRHLLVSIAAGKTIGGMTAALGRECRLVRVMPNLALQVGEGMSVYYRGGLASEADGKRVARIFAAAGRVIELGEEHFDAVTALSGSGPAFFTYAMQALADGTAATGLPAAQALELAMQTMLGTAKVLLTTGQTPEAFIRAVASPQGTTAAGLTVLENSDLRSIMARTVAAAAGRSAELSRI